MSDDEYYADSPYDEFEEMLWDADPAPNLADDLAQHASYSPVWQDDPIGELQAYHSDWEYYSDDYYDDDPAILKSNPASGSPSRSQNTAKFSNKKGRKRKLDEFQDPVKHIATQSLRSAIQGTVWAKDEPPKITVFRSGQHERVALLTDWRKRFKLENDIPQLKNRKQVKRDESWANDLGLTDMGLTRVQEGHRTVQETNVGEGDTDDEEEEKEEMGRENITSAEDEAEDSESVKQASEQPLLDKATTLSQGQVQDQEPGTGATRKVINTSDTRISSAKEDTDQPAGKRRKINQQNQRRSSNQTQSETATEGTTDLIDTSQDTVDGSLQLDQNHTTLSDDTLIPNQMSGFDTADTTFAKTGRKRKASISSETSSTTVGSRPSRRAKRIASDRLKETVGATTSGSKSTRKIRATKGTKT